VASHSVTTVANPTRRLRRLVARSRRGNIDHEHIVLDRGFELAPYLQAGDRVAVHHLIRYQWARAAMGEGRAPQRILDVGCGSGYGSAMLATEFPDAEVVGVDYDPKAVGMAARRHQAPNLSYRVGDVTRWNESIGIEPFDHVVTFDTIEHVRHREIMLMNIVDHLEPDGAMLLSTPTSSELTLEPRWPHHQLEYSYQALLDLLRRYFRVVLRPDDKSLPARSVFDVLDGTGISYARAMNPVIGLEPVRVDETPR
jgi:ubiquinone/menaquinone biosynthesis C-methylase UbiE